MWPKTFIALFLGCILSISIVLNINVMLTIPVDEKLLAGLLLAFPIWVAFMVMCYSSVDTLQAFKRIFFPLIMSIMINIFIL